jgi:hypothetical protein
MFLACTDATRRKIMVSSDTKHTAEEPGMIIMKCDGIRSAETRSFAKHSGLHTAIMDAATCHDDFGWLLRTMVEALQEKDITEPLHFAFRCPGGRHRSVACAAIADHVLTYLGHEVECRHEELLRGGDSHLVACKECEGMISEEKWNRLLKRWSGLRSSPSHKK